MFDKAIALIVWAVTLFLLSAVFIKLARGEGRRAAAPKPGGSSDGEKEKITPVGLAALACSFIGAAYLALHAGAFFFLAYLYGFPRVLAELLHFVEMPKGRPWVVSNGDLITEGHYVHFLLTAPLIVAIVFVLYALAARFSPWPLFRGGCNASQPS